MILQERTPSHKWWDDALSLVTGCSPVSPGCQNCWLAALENRVHPDGEFSGSSGGWSGRVRFHEDRLKKPGKTKKPTVFALWSDLGHVDVGMRNICATLDMMGNNPKHTFIILTKRPENLSIYNFPENVILGTSAENQEQYDLRKFKLLASRAKIKTLSLEPLLGPIDLGDLTGIDWVIVGAESKGNGPGRNCNLGWVSHIVWHCIESGVPVFVKQIHWLGKLVKDYEKFPMGLRCRSLPREIK